MAKAKKAAKKRKPDWKKESPKMARMFEKDVLKQSRKHKKK